MKTATETGHNQGHYIQEQTVGSIWTMGYNELAPGGTLIGLTTVKLFHSLNLHNGTQWHAGLP